MIGRERLAGNFDVPRETLEKLDRYAVLLSDWQGRMNLVGPSTLSHVWHRHFADSAQLLPIAGVGRSWLDVGSGAGFPGLIIATLDPAAHVTLVESIAKKCRFLETVVSELELGGRVIIENRRIETLSQQRFDIITARALAALDQLFDWCLPFADPSTLWLLPKGARWADEVAKARLKFQFNISNQLSLTDDAAQLLLVRKVAKA